MAESVCSRGLSESRVVLRDGWHSFPLPNPTTSSRMFKVR
jgi:hypothetical protein